MKAALYLALVALLTVETQGVQFTDDIVKMLAVAEKEEEAESKNPPKPEPVKKEEPKPAAPKKDSKIVDDDIPMDNQAIKAYSSVIADAAEDSEPEHPVQYIDISEEKKQDTRLAQAPK